MSDHVRSGAESAGSLSEKDRSSVANTRANYERIPYHTNPWHSSQPALLQTTARLWGLEAADADDCRFLELGCGDGGNLLPLALAHPESTFVGIDLAKVHIDAGIALRDQLGLENARLETTSFVDLGEDLGSFDYIVAHGLMSWVTPNLQEHLFATCKRLLSDRGVAFISYNTYPGWTMQHAIRELLRQHSRGVQDIEVRIERSRELLEILVRTVPEHEKSYLEYLESVGAVARDPDKRYYFAHEYLEDDNHPFYVLDFIERASRHGLQYLADAELVDMELDNMAPEPSALLHRLLESAAPDTDHLAQRLQILDYSVNRKFRQSLLCHEEVAVARAPDLERVASMWVSTRLRPEPSAVDLGDGSVARFVDQRGRTIEVDQPLVKAALLRFSEETHEFIAFGALADWARRRLGSRPVSEDPEEERKVLALVLGRLHLAKLADLRASPPCWALTPGERPLASPLVRRNASRRERTTSLRHTSISLDNERVCEVLSLLDGTRDRAALLQHLEGRLPAEELEKILELAAKNGVLMQACKRGRC